MAQENEARVYGMADPANRQPPAAQGIRGEKSASDETGYRHAVTLGDGRQVAVAEESGVAFAEATGRAARVRPAPPPKTRPGPVSNRGGVRNSLPMILGLAVSAAILGVTAWQLRSAKQGQRPRHDGVASGHDVGDAVGNGDVGEEAGIGFRPAREIADQGQVDFEPAR
jgi:hypothetical protein